MLRGRLTPLLCTATVFGAVAIGGCGDDGDSTANDEIKYSMAGEQPKVFIERMGKLLATAKKRKDCPVLDQIAARSYVRFTCPADKKFRASMAKFKVVAVGEYGNGAVIDYKSGDVPDGAAIVLFVAPDRNWGISKFGVVTEPSTETSDEDSREGYDSVVNAYLDAVRERDCSAFLKVVLITGDDEKAPCKSVFPPTKDLAKRLKADPSAKPKYEGGNATYGFFTIETKKPVPENATISVIRDTDEGATKPYMVLDVAPSPTSDEQRRIREQLKQQQKNKPAPGMAPKSSKKPLPQKDTTDE
jgi:hypothetical protein